MMEEKEIKVPEIRKPNGWQKLAAVQSRITVAKGNTAAHYKYYTTADILDEAKPLLKEVGAAVTMTDEIEEHGGLIFLKCTATFTDADTGEDVKTVTGIVEYQKRSTMDAAQSTGAASTYARKRALAGLLLVDGEKDPDSLKPEAPTPKGKPQRSAREELQARLSAEGVDAEDFSKLGYNAPFSKMPEKTAAEVLQNFAQYLQGYRELAAKANEEIPL